MTTPTVTVSASEKDMTGKRTLTFTLKLEVEIDGCGNLSHSRRGLHFQAISQFFFAK